LLIDNHQKPSLSMVVCLQNHRENIIITTIAMKN